MSKSLWLLSTAIVAIAVPAHAQTPPAGQAPADAATTSDTPSPTEQAGSVAAPAPAPAAAIEATDNGDIIVTATRRNEALSNVPLAVSAVTGDTLTRSGATDIRALNQLSPSLLVSSTTSDAGGAVARIRGIGTVGDNPGLESSVALFVDGVYRSRTGTGLTELGAIDRIEVLRGPQGTLFGRNASAGLISVITAKPKFEEEGTAELSYGNYDYWRGIVGLTGPINSKIAYRLDGVYVKRDGFIKEGTYAGSTGRDFNDKDRYLVRGQLLFQPDDDISFRLIGDYSRKNEECCVGVYLPTRDVRRSADGSLATSASSTAAVLRSLGGFVSDRPYDRRASVTPGRTYRQDVEDWGASGELNWDFGPAALTSITAYRYNDYKRGQDADFNSLDLLYRPDDGRDFIKFRTFSQELRLQGEAFAGKLDWLVGGYYADERLDVRSSLTYGADYDRYITQLVRGSGGAAAQFPGFNNLRGFVSAGLAQQGLPAAVIAPVAALIPNIATYANTGQNDRYRQRSRNFAFFTHNVIHVTDTLSVTLGARYTNEDKRLRAAFASTVPAGNAAASLAQSVAQLRALAASTANPFIRAAATGAAGGVGALAPAAALYGVLTPFNGTLPSRKRKEDEWTGTAVVSWKPAPELLTYASYSKGYKAGGFNLDRSVLGIPLLGQPAPDLSQLEFESEKVDAYEVGAKYNGRGFDINVALFQQDFKNFQLNNFQGVNFIVANIKGCTELSGGPGADSDQSAATGECIGKIKPGVRSRGVEIEAFIRPADNFNVNVGFTLADTQYRNDLSTTRTALNPSGALPTSLVNLPGRRVSNSSYFTVTTGAGWTPDLGTGGLRGLLYADLRYQSDINTGSDLFYEKRQDGVVTVNARVGVSGGDGRWSLEFWGQNIFDVDYTQVAFNMPTQGTGDTLSVLNGQQASANRLYGAFLAEPRTYGVTVRTKF
ncbi:TonB-dependent receptor [Sphingomonas profundi]|uniref:TonB-dependent receptor n=1 Tax=Alterirhizorhabdus profundi TaxID=2681549 RepID=UPI0012E8C32E|nr:TonB-dependent receptor [Sphingomonas profundi]